MTRILTAALTFILTATLNATTPTPARPAPVAPVGKVNVNTATEAQLQLLPGVGPKLANEIYTYAEAGPKLYDPKAPVNSGCDHKCHIPTLAELDNVKGVGPAKLSALAPYVTFTGPTTLTVKVKSPTRKSRSVK